uniref:Uncharacterized protein n=1 Tax=Plectus sambesii TaxID=2011161 RepID=A0A914VXN0_9BILA
MLIYLVAVPLVMMACASEALENTFNCTATGNGIYGCLFKPEQKKSLTQFLGQLALHNMQKVTVILKKQKTIGCIKTSEWANIQAWIKLWTPPKAYIAVFKSLSKDQRTTIQQAAKNIYDEQLQKKAQAVYDVIIEKHNSLSEADRMTIFEWNNKCLETCGTIML